MPRGSKTVAALAFVVFSLPLALGLFLYPPCG
jgi:hypothetical protein